MTGGENRENTRDIISSVDDHPWLIKLAMLLLLLVLINPNK